ncbi:MAG: DUF3326 domain-containing protein [Gloeomargarita sp. SKYBB_i_bin120]|nr:DUF3326 domain-containing protein [Gloeomargarita sp. SKYG98]MCS7291446.1 DUF3326 domain-containing protein [Gloeomargarita sp. SKYB120]MDW8177006.1 DUF3326 domain-containing protein [Gloeomargarita sp. SKYBB_i_bin120]
MVNQRPYTAALVIPTGIGAAVGGYAGDALPVVRALAEVVDCLITHPNVLNGAMLYWPSERVWYVEGYALDQFAAGVWGLQPVHDQRIGVVLDSGIEPDLQLRHQQVMQAAQATLGLPIAGWVQTDTPLGVTLQKATSGATWGTIAQPDSLLRAVGTLKERYRVTAVAVVARFPEVEAAQLQDYRQGRGVDPLAGAEAIISHLVVRTFQLPCAHAPAVRPLPLDPTVDPRAAAEELGYTFLPSVLVGLSRAPSYVTQRTAGSLWTDAVDAVVVPATACGGAAVLHWAAQGKRVIAVSENVSRMAVSPEALDIPAIQVASYLEAIGVVAAHKAGVDWRWCGRRYAP